jgi:predicted nucleic acid-binding Zn ribbon protein
MESIGNALQKFLNSSKWNDRLMEMKIKDEWEKIMGKTIAKYTNSVTFHNQILTIYTNVAPLKQELINAQDAVIETINKYLDQEVIKKIIIK